MKNIIITLFACFIALSINAQENGKMEMHVSLPSSMFKGERNATLSLEIMTEKGDISIGSLQLTGDANGMLTGDASIDIDGQYCASALWTEDPHYGFSFFAEPGIINVKVGKGNYLSKTMVTGSPLNDVFQTFKEEYEPADKARTLDNEAKDSLLVAYMKKYADTPLFGLLFDMHSAVTYSSFNDTKEEVERLWAIGGEKPKKVKYFLDTYNRICHNNLADGQPFRDVEIPDATVEDSRTVHLSDYVGKGKWVFIDFWASWCGGCRQAIPRVKDAYEQVKDENILFISIAEWDKRPAALKAMKEENMPWLQLIDEKGACGSVYMFNSIPRLMLFAPDGTIADCNVNSMKVLETIKEKITKQ